MWAYVGEGGGKIVECNRQSFPLKIASNQRSSLNKQLAGCIATTKTSSQQFRIIDLRSSHARTRTVAAFKQQLRAEFCRSSDEALNQSRLHHRSSIPSATDCTVDRVCNSARLLPPQECPRPSPSALLVTPSMTPSTYPLDTTRARANSAVRYPRGQHLLRSQLRRCVCWGSVNSASRVGAASGLRMLIEVRANSRTPTSQRGCGR